MFGSNLMISGLTIGVVWWISFPFAYSNLAKERDIKEVVAGIQIEPVTQQVAKTIKSFNLSLTDSDADVNNGVFAKITLKEEGDKRTGSLDETTWKGSKGQDKGFLYHDDETRLYTLADRIGTNGKAPCYGNGLGGKNSVICLAGGRIAPQFKNTGEKEFLKVKLSGGKTFGTSTRGYSESLMPSYLERCHRADIVEQADNNLKVSIHCKDVILYKTFKSPEISESALNR